VKKDIEMRSLFSGLTETMHIFEVNQKTEIVDANELFLDMLNFGIEEIRGRKMRMLMREEFLHSANFKEISDKISLGNAFKSSVEVKAKDGKLFECQSLITAILDSEGNLTKIKFVFFNVVQI
jgi:PAS domain S-box-containing protein